MIEFGQGGARRRQRLLLAEHFVHELGEDVQFERQRTVGGGGDARFDLGELRRREAHRVGHGLTVNEGLHMRRLGERRRMQRGDLDEIAEHVVVAHLEAFDAGGVGIGRLQTGDDLAAAVAQIAVLVEIAAEAAADKAAVAGIDGKLRRQGRAQRLLHFRRCCRQALDNAHQLARQAERFAGPQELRGEIVGGNDRLAHGPKVARTAAAKRETRQGAREIGRGFQRGPQLSAQSRFGHQIGHGIEPGVYIGLVGQRTGQAARQLAGARGGNGAVHRRQQTAGPRALIGPGELEICASRGIDQKETSGGFLSRRAQQRCAADLGDLHIGEQPAKRGQFRPREVAEGVERRHAETFL